MQARRLGQYLDKLTQTHDLPPIEAVYSSPMVRCCMTAGEAVIGYSSSAGAGAGASAGAGDRDRDRKGNTNTAAGEQLNLKVKIEHGLVESMNDKWYRSWCLPNSDGSWGGPEPGPAAGGNFETGVFPPVDEGTIDTRAKVPADSLIQTPSDISQFLSDYSGDANDTSLANTAFAHDFETSREVASLILHHQQADDDDDEHGASIFSLEGRTYKWGSFESRTSQQDRMQHVVETLAERHPNGTILLVSHGGPVTHLYERLTGNDWSVHGVSSYTSFSVYQRSDADGDEEGDSCWKALMTNDSTHVQEMHMESSDQASSFV